MESVFVDCTLERIWMRMRTMISKTQHDREGRINTGSSAWESLSVKEAKMQYVNLQIYTTCCKKHKFFWSLAGRTRNKQL